MLSDVFASSAAISVMSASLPMQTPKPSWIIMVAFFAITSSPGDAAIAMTDPIDAARESTMTRTWPSRWLRALWMAMPSPAGGGWGADRWGGWRGTDW